MGCLRWFRTFEGGAITQPPKSENGHALPGSVGLSQFHCGGLVLAGGFRASHGFSSFQAPRSRCRWGCGCSFFLLPLNGAAVVSVFDVPLPVDFLLRRRGIDGGLWGGLLFLLGPHPLAWVQENAGQGDFKLTSNHEASHRNRLGG